MNRMMTSKAFQIMMLMQGVFGNTAVPDIQGPVRTAPPNYHGGDGNATCARENAESCAESFAAPSILQRGVQVESTIGTDDKGSEEKMVFGEGGNISAPTEVTKVSTL